MKSKTKDYLFFGSIGLLLIVLIGATYAYFRLQIEGSGKDIVLDTGDLRLRYTDGSIITLNNAMPGDTVTKTVTVENIGTRNVTYNLYWSDLINTIERYELHASLECKSYTGYGTSSQAEDGTCETINRAVPISDVSSSSLIKNNLPISVGVTHEYTITVTFDNKDYDQSYNMKKSFSGKVDVREYSSPSPVYCTYDGELIQGTTFTKGIYTYSYKQKGTSTAVIGSLDNNDNLFVHSSKEQYYNPSLMDTTSSNLGWENMDLDGWGVQLTDKDSTDAVTEAPCTSINDKPVVSYVYMFGESKASSIDLSNFDTSKVTDMSWMFFYSKSTEIKGLDNFDTSKITDMSYMFYNNNANSLDLVNFNTSKVTNMCAMFAGIEINTLNLENFNTSNVTDMSNMFQSSRLTSLNISNFDTSNVTDMTSMFNGTTVNYLNLSNFDTNNVTSMRSMFSLFKLEELDLTSFDFNSEVDVSEIFFASDTKIVYVKDENGANLINNDSHKPDTLTVIVK